MTEEIKLIENTYKQIYKDFLNCAADQEEEAHEKVMHYRKEMVKAGFTDNRILQLSQYVLFAKFVSNTYREPFKKEYNKEGSKEDEE